MYIVKTGKFINNSTLEKQNGRQTIVNQMRWFFDSQEYNSHYRSMVLDTVISCDWKGRLPVETKGIRSVIIDPRASSEKK